MPVEPNTSPLIELRNVSVVSPRSAAVRVLEGVNWRVSAGEFWVAAGPAGMGKSALLQTAAGLLSPAAGEVRLFGQPTAALAEAELRQTRLRISLLFEGGGRLFAPMTVAENVALPYCYHHNCTAEEAAEPLAAVLAWTELSAYAGQRPGRVPRALCPRIGLARALITSPEALLVDNPLHGLDQHEQAWWLAALRRLAREPAPGQSRPLTLVVAADDFRPWLEIGSHFALVQRRAFAVIGDRAAVETQRAASLADVPAPPAGFGPA